MKTIKDDIKRRIIFDSILDNYKNSNISDYEMQLESLSKRDLIRFINYLQFLNSGYRVQINGQELFLQTY
jgi:hypothetical protein